MSEKGRELLEKGRQVLSRNLHILANRIGGPELAVELPPPPPAANGTEGEAVMIHKAEG